MYASTRMSPFGILLELRMTEAVVTTAATSRANLQSNKSSSTRNQRIAVYNTEGFSQPTASQH